jgi:hypothetical protein
LSKTSETILGSARARNTSARHHHRKPGMRPPAYVARLLLLLDGSRACTYIPLNPLAQPQSDVTATLGKGKTSPPKFNPSGVGDLGGYAAGSEAMQVWNDGFEPRAGLGACGQYAWKEMALVVGEGGEAHLVSHLE